jgi:hypothetical protein
MKDFGIFKDMNSLIESTQSLLSNQEFKRPELDEVDVVEFDSKLLESKYESPATRSPFGHVNEKPVKMIIKTLNKGFEGEDKQEVAEQTHEDMIKETFSKMFNMKYGTHDINDSFEVKNETSDTPLKRLPKGW